MAGGTHLPVTVKIRSGVVIPAADTTLEKVSAATGAPLIVAGTLGTF